MNIIIKNLKSPWVAISPPNGRIGASPAAADFFRLAVVICAPQITPVWRKSGAESTESGFR